MVKEGPMRWTGIDLETKEAVGWIRLDIKVVFWLIHAHV